MTITVDLSRYPSVYEAGLPTIDYWHAENPDEAHEVIRRARRQAPIALGPHGPELLTYDLVRAVARAPLPLVPAGPPDGAPEARPPRPPGTARRRCPGAAPRRRTHHRSGRQPGSRGAVTPAPPPCARGPPRPRLATAGSVLPQRPVRPRRPVTAPGAVRTVQGCPIQG